MNERGMGPVKLMVILLLLIGVGYIVTNFIIVRAHYQTVKEKVKEQARFAGTNTDDEIFLSIVQKGKEVDLMLGEEEISVQRVPGEEITINVSYPDSIVLPLRLYTFHFNFRIEETAPLPR